MSHTISIAANGASACLVEADCATYLRNLDSETVDLLVTSPPYFIGKEYDASKNISDFEKIFVDILPDIGRVLKPGGSICLQVGNHVCDSTIVPLDYLAANAMRRNPEFQLRNRIIWTFSHGTHARRRFSGRHETILWYTKGMNYFFDLDAVRVPQKYPGKKHYKGPNRGKFSGNPLGKNPGDHWEFGAIWDIPNVKAKHIEKTEHPCQYPLALARRLIRALCPKAGVVLDPFVGSGTTAVAAVLDGRNCIGSDISRRYLTIAESRLNALVEGTLRIRTDKPVLEPTGKELVSVVPSHFNISHGEKYD